MTYRNDIEGFRAFAVMIVLLFHFHTPYFSGGYIGVDIFFVISGYLISGNIITQARQNTFKLTTFYRNRILRLFPAMFLTVIATLLAGLAILTPLQMEELSKSAIYAVLNLSNILFWAQAGYFDTASVSKPLLHTWSLSVEEQFYLFWPFILLLLLKLRKHLTLGLILLIVAVFALSEIVIKYDPAAAFFFTPLRMWQFAAGALIWQIRNKVDYSAKPIINIGLVLAGLLAIAYCTVTYNEDTQFPGVAAILPTVATAAILFSYTNILSRIVLENPISRYIGRISYSLYLVHWPLVVYYGIKKKTDFTSTDTLILLAASFVLATILYQVAEKRNHKLRKKISTSSTFAVTAASALMFCVPVSHLWKSSSFLARGIDPELVSLRTTLESAKDKRRAYIAKSQIQADNNFDPAKPTIAILGDSLADDIFVALREGYADYNFVRFVENGCRPIIDYRNNSWGDARRIRCNKFVETAFPEILMSKSITTVVIDSKWTDASLAELQPTVSKLSDAGKRVVFLQPRVRLSGGGIALSGKVDSISEFQDLAIEKAETERTALYTDVIASVSGAEILPLKDIQCRLGCTNIIAGTNIPLVYDNAHLTIEGSKYLGREIAKAYPDFFKTP